jgi:ketosteroid isomerase-like protein
VITETLSEAILRADAAFFEALIDRDIQALEALLGEEFLIVDVASGTVHSRAAFLDAIGGLWVTFKQIKTFPEETTLRLAGPGAGIVVGRTAMSLSDTEGALTEVASRYTHVFHTTANTGGSSRRRGLRFPAPRPNRSPALERRSAPDRFKL